MSASTKEINPSPETLRGLKELILEITQLKMSPDQISDTANLFNDCGVDSTSVVDLVVGLEERFGVTVEDDELDVSLFENISTLATFIEARQAAD